MNRFTKQLLFLNTFKNAIGKEKYEGEVSQIG
ncbi:hypothetical protein protein [Bacillus cereus G9241]|nr:hypothetical protein protein [Bacillus cereus G9241]